MRVSIPALALAAAVALGGCGDDEPEQADIPRPAPTQRVRPDTTVGDTGAARAGGGAQPGQQAGEAGETGEAGGQAGRQAGPAAPGGGQPGAGEGGAGGGGEAAGERRLYTVQVAAFTSPDSAQKWTGRLSSLNLPVWMSMAELGGTTYYRVRVGAVHTFAEARQLGALMTERFEWPVWVAPVTPSDRMPADAVAATRRVLGGN